MNPNLEPTHICSGLTCKGRQWQVEGLAKDLFNVSDLEGSTFIVAASRPICPRCASALAPLSQEITQATLATLA
ncbi:hypothetical protein [Calidithermus chliarophilus]|uniref:hypothetical protein n=1 Tax=Calidithermus chliarophilus TaxID=52023 RepID=UPI0004027BA9|nr:hypothetical protein [Calidithermus chliarophilus]